MSVNEVILSVIAASVVVLVIFTIWLSLKLMDEVKTVRAIIESTNETIREVSKELTGSLRSLRAVTDDVGAVTDDVRTLTGSFTDVGHGVRQLAENVKEIGKTVQDLGTETVASVCGLRAGLRAGFEVFLKNLLG